MRQSGNGTGNIRQNIDPAMKKAYEVCYALFRIAAKVQNAAFRDSMERHALVLLDWSLTGDPNGIWHAANNAQYLLKFGGDVGLVHISNVSTVNDELNVLKSLAAESSQGADQGITRGPEEISLVDIFSRIQPSGKALKVNAEPPEDLPEVESGNESSGNEQSGNPATDPAIDPAIIKINSRSGNSNENSESQNNDPAIRQSAILTKIRQSGNCRLKDISEILPDTSERTIRYDLQSLVERNLVERVGSGGPMVFYRPRH